MRDELIGNYHACSVVQYEKFTVYIFCIFGYQKGGLASLWF